MKSNSSLRKSAFLDSRTFGVLAIVYGVLGLLLVAHHICSYEAILRPHMSFLMENKVLTNDSSGPDFLFFFTYESNILVSVYLLLLGIGLLGSKKLYSFTHNDRLRGAVTLYIAVTGIVYCAILLPFSSSSFPWSEKIWFSNVVNFWMHMLTPALMLAFWFKSLDSRDIPPVKTSLQYMVYPLAYFVVCIARGEVTGFYPYPFLNSRQLWDVLHSGMVYNELLSKLMIVIVTVLFIAVFFGLGAILSMAHNRLVGERAVRNRRVHV